MDLELHEGEIRRCELRLHALHRELRRGLDRLEAETLDASDVEDDEGSEADSDALNLGIIEQERATIREIVSALDRIQDGTFGRCQACGRWIARARLDVVPYASRCVACTTEP
ncbi:MAG: TraR/DksA family transcriptional regulator [Planctomycetota bacterium]